MNERQPEGYNVIRELNELRVEPIEMKPKIEYSPVQRVTEAWRQRRFMRRDVQSGRKGHK